MKQKLKSITLDLQKYSVLAFSWIRNNKLKAIIALLGSGLLTLVLLVLSIYWGAFGKIPTSQDLIKIKNPLATTIYSGNNKIIGSYYIENRSNIDSSQINNYVKEALIATEDARFLEHSGIDYRSLGRVVVKSILMQDRSSGGGSTITQQLAKNVFGRKSSSFFSLPINKIREMIIAKRLENLYSKDDILLMYLNTVPFGEGLYGIEKAANRFFNKTPETLSLNEAASIIGILKATTYYNPRKNPENNLRRRNIVLAQMKKYGYIDDLIYQSESPKKLNLQYTLPKKSNSYAVFYKDFLKNEFDNWAMANPKPDGTIYNIHTDGLKITTTIHSSIQESSEKALSNQIKKLQLSFNKNWDAVGGKDNYIEKLILKSELGKRMINDSINLDSIKHYFDVKKLRKIWNGTEVESGEYSILDSLLFEVKTLQGCTMAIHAPTGKIMAYVGGKDYGYSQYDQLSMPKQIGSTFKPIVYLAALEKGIKLCDFFDNELRSYSSYKDWTPRNSNRKYGGSYSLFGALANSVNTVSVQVMFEAGIKNVINLATRLGINSKLPEVPSLVLGTAEIKPIEIFSAYGAIANGGYQVTPYSLQKIESMDGEILYQASKQEGKLVANQNSVKSLQQMMTYTNKIGTGRRIENYQIPYNLIGKTGTTQNNADGWYIASSPEIVCGAWVGTMNPSINFSTTGLGSGSNTALPIVGRVFGDLSQWNTQIISNFEFEEPFIRCPAYSDFDAKEAQARAETGMLSIEQIGNIFKGIFDRTQ